MVHDDHHAGDLPGFGQYILLAAQNEPSSRSQRYDYVRVRVRARDRVHVRGDDGRPSRTFQTN